MTEKTIQVGQDIRSESAYGLRVDVTITDMGEDKPKIYTYMYKLDTIKFKQWLEEHPYLCEGPLAFTARGIQVMVVGGAKKWDKSAFSISIESGEKLFLPLLTREIKFTVHKDLFSGEEWDVALDTSLLDLEEAVIDHLLANEE